MNEMPSMLVSLPRPRRKSRDQHPLQPLAQAMELRDRYERAQIKHDLQPGMLCIEKVGIAYFSDKPVLMLWRMLDPEAWLDRQIVRDYIENHMITAVDCIVVRLSDDATHVQFFPHALEFLEPYQEEVEDSQDPLEKDIVRRQSV